MNNNLSNNNLSNNNLSKPVFIHTKTVDLADDRAVLQEFGDITDRVGYVILRYPKKIILIEAFRDYDSFMHPRRDQDNLWTWVTSRGAGYSDPSARDIDDYDAELASASWHKQNLTSKLYLYRHSGDVISRRPFSCPWDSGQMGFAFVSYDTVRSYLGVKNITKNVKSKAFNILDAEIAEMNAVNRGDCYNVCTHIVTSTDVIVEYYNTWWYTDDETERQELLNAVWETTPLSVRKAKEAVDGLIESF